MQEEEEKLSAHQPGAPPPPATAPTPKPKSSSKLTAEQQAEWEAKLRLIVEQLAKPNTAWDRRGSGTFAYIQSGAGIAERTTSLPVA